MRVVLDTNALISALLWRGAPRRVVDLAIAGRFQALTSPELLTEFEAVLAEGFGLPQDKVELALRDVLSYAEVVVLLEEPEIQVRDAADATALACALAGRADTLVTGDQDLLSLGTVRDIRILTVRTFLEERARHG